MNLKQFGYAAFIAVTAAAFIIGSGTTGEAKAKKKEAAPPTTTACFMIASGPVCGTKSGMKYTYKNSCYAAKDGATVASDKACPPAKAIKSGKKKAAKKVAKPAAAKPAAAAAPAAKPADKK